MMCALRIREVTHFLVGVGVYLYLTEAV